MKYARKVSDKDGIILYAKKNGSFEPSAPKAVKRTGEVVVIDDTPCEAGEMVAFEVFNHEDYPKGGIYILKQDYSIATEPLSSNEKHKNSPPNMKNQTSREDSFISTPIERQLTSFKDDSGHNNDEGDFVNDKASRQAKKAAKKKSKEDKKAAKNSGKEEGAGGGSDKASPNQLFNEAKKKGYKGNFKEFMKKATDNGWIEKGIGIAADLAERFGKKGKNVGASESAGDDVLPASTGTESTDNKIFGVIPKPLFLGGVVVVVGVGTYLVYRAVSKPSTEGAAAAPAAAAAV